jgi:hypothetical protein
MGRKTVRKTITSRPTNKAFSVSSYSAIRKKSWNAAPITTSAGITAIRAVDHHKLGGGSRRSAAAFLFHKTKRFVVCPDDSNSLIDCQDASVWIIQRNPLRIRNRNVALQRFVSPSHPIYQSGQSNMTNLSNAEIQRLELKLPHGSNLSRSES